MSTDKRKLESKSGSLVATKAASRPRPKKAITNGLAKPVKHIAYGRDKQDSGLIRHLKLDDAAYRLEKSAHGSQLFGPGWVAILKTSKGPRVRPAGDRQASQTDDDLLSAGARLKKEMLAGSWTALEALQSHISSAAQPLLEIASPMKVNAWPATFVVEVLHSMLGRLEPAIEPWLGRRKEVPAIGRSVTLGPDTAQRQLTVEEIGEESFTAIWEEEGERDRRVRFPRYLVAADDLDAFREGAEFYWVSGWQMEGGQPTRVDELRFRRQPPPSQRQLSDYRELAKKSLAAQRAHQRKRQRSGTQQ